MYSHDHAGYLSYFATSAVYDDDGEWVGSDLRATLAPASASKMVANAPVFVPKHLRRLPTNPRVCKEMSKLPFAQQQPALAHLIRQLEILSAAAQSYTGVRKSSWLNNRKPGIVHDDADDETVSSTRQGLVAPSTTPRPDVRPLWETAVLWGVRDSPPDTNRTNWVRVWAAFPRKVLMMTPAMVMPSPDPPRARSESTATRKPRVRVRVEKDPDATPMPRSCSTFDAKPPPMTRASSASSESAQSRASSLFSFPDGESDNVSLATSVSARSEDGEDATKAEDGEECADASEEDDVLCDFPPISVHKTRSNSWLKHAHTTTAPLWSRVVAPLLA